VVHEAAATGFGRSADAYERGRPDYPDAAIDWLWDRLELTGGSHALDVGAGTGKLTSPLVERGARVIAVEPVGAMRERLVAAIPGAKAIGATAESLPLAAGSVDAVVAGQAFHWFATEVALDSFHRVLRPTGRLGLIWNRRKLDDPLQAAISELLDPLRGDTPHHASELWRRPLERSELFTPIGSHEVEFAQELDEQGLVDRVGSTSFVAALAEADRVELLDRIRALAAGAETLRLPYTCEAFAYQRVHRP
jgi:SAM-dependent methyltransferase